MFRVLQLMWLAIAPGARERAVRETFAGIGIALETGVGLFDALCAGALATAWPPLARSLEALARRIDAGDPLDLALGARDVAAIPLRARMVLGTTLPDRSKGVLLQALNPDPGAFAGDRPELSTFSISSWAPLIFDAGLLAMIFLSMAVFVLPQFHEVLRGMRIAVPWPTTWFLALSNWLTGSPLAAFAVYLSVVGAAGLAIWHLIAPRAIDIEMAALLQVLATVPRADHVTVLASLANRHLMPRLGAALAEVQRGLEQGQASVAPLLAAGAPQLPAWLCHLTLVGANPTPALTVEAAQLLETASRCRSRRWQTVLLLGCHLGVGLLVALTLGSVVMAMTAMMRAALE